MRHNNAVYLRLSHYSIEHDAYALEELASWLLIIKNVGFLESILFALETS
jgi:hypothetical protein